MKLNSSEHRNGDIRFCDELNVYFLSRTYDNFDDLVGDEGSMMNRILDLDFAIIDKSMCLRYKNGQPQWVTRVHLKYLK